VDEVLKDYTHGSPPFDKGDDEADIICPTFMSIMGLPENKHFDPVTSQNGDSATSGPNDPGLVQMGRDIFSHASRTAIQSLLAPFMFLLAIILYS
jgi:hypothetical protein